MQILNKGTFTRDLAISVPSLSHGNPTNPLQKQQAFQASNGVHPRRFPGGFDD